MKKVDKKDNRLPFFFPPRLIKIMADEVAKTVVNRLPSMLPKRQRKKKEKKVENAIFLDTSAIIDGRIFDIIALRVFSGVFVILESILLELKHIADSRDTVKRLRGRKGLELLENLKKTKGIKIVILPENSLVEKQEAEVDEKLIQIAKNFKGRIITCDYNLEKKAAISGIVSINMNTLANLLKVTAVPGEVHHIRVLHKGKDVTQGVGYLDDGTMLVVENGSEDLGKEVDVVVSRVIQTSAGRILFAKKIS